MGEPPGGDTHRMSYRRTRPSILRAEPSDPSRGRQLRRLHTSGRLVRLRSGAYFDAEEWNTLGSGERHLVQAWAIAPDLSRSTAFSHMTAALILGWPLLGAAPRDIHVVDAAATSVTHRVGIVRHVIEPSGWETAPTRFDGVEVTAPLLTASMVARTCDAAVATVAIDGAVRAGEFTAAELVARLPEAPGRGTRRARTVAAALDARHESPGESYTSIRLVQSGVTEIERQRAFHHDGYTDRVDFWLPELGVVIEFDGKQKYVDPALLNGRDPGDVLWREKLREDRLRRRPEVRAVIRVTWWHLASLDRFRALFRSHGIPL